MSTEQSSRQVKRVAQQVNKMKRQNKNQWWFDPLFLCLQIAKDHGVEFKRIMLASIEAKYMRTVFSVLHDHLYQPAIVSAFKRRWICFKTYLKMYFRIMGTIMLKICQTIKVPHSEASWLTYFLHWRERLVNKQIRVRSTSIQQKDGKKKISQIRGIPAMQQRMRAIDDEAYSQSSLKQSMRATDSEASDQMQSSFSPQLFDHVIASASIATVFADKDEKVATKMVSPNAKERFNRERTIFLKFYPQYQNRHDRLDILEARIFVESKVPEFDMKEEFNTLMIAHKQFQSETFNPSQYEYWHNYRNRVNISLSVPKPLVYWNGYDAFSMEYCKGKTAKQLIQHSADSFEGRWATNDQLIMHEVILAILYIIKNKGNPDNEEFIKYVKKYCGFSYNAFHAIPEVIKTIRRLLQDMAHYPRNQVNRFVVHTDPSLGNIIFSEERSTPYLIDFGDACIFYLNDDKQKKLLQTFQKYVEGIGSINPGWDAIKKQFEDEVDKITTTRRPSGAGLLRAQQQDQSTDDFSFYMMKQKIKSAMSKYHAILNEMAKLIGPIFMKLLEKSDTILNALKAARIPDQKLDLLKGKVEALNTQLSSAGANSNDYYKFVILFIDLGFNNDSVQWAMRQWKPKQTQTIPKVVSWST